MRNEEGRGPKAPANSADVITTRRHHPTGAVDDTREPDTRCVVEGCERKPRAKDYCASHYSRWRRHGDPLAGGRDRLKVDGTLEERLLARIEKQANGCWVWTGARCANGYGQIMYAYTQKKTHRAAYETWVGPIPDGLVLDHKCHNRACCNPAHLEAVSNAVNTFRRAGANSGATSSWRGVTLDKGRNKWRATIRRHDKYYSLGSFTDELDAARAAAEKYAELGDPKPLRDLNAYLEATQPAEQLDLWGAL